MHFWVPIFLAGPYFLYFRLKSAWIVIADTIYTVPQLVPFGVPFLSDPGKPGVRSLGPDVRHWVQEVCEDFTDVTLADEDNNSIPTDDANRAMTGKWHHMVVKF